MMVHTMKRVQSNASPSPKLATRRTHDATFKRRLVELTLAPRASVARIALEHRLNANILFRWRREHLRELAQSVAMPAAAMLPVTMIESDDLAQKSTPPTLSLMSERKACAAPLSAGSLEIALPLGWVTLKGGIDCEVLRLVIALLSRP
jgi:transposase